MSSFAQTLAADRRLVILRVLTETNLHANEQVLKRALDVFGHRISGDMLRSDLAWLEEQALIRVEKLQAPSGELWIAHLLGEGQDVAEGRTHRPGVARRGAD